MQKSSTKKPFLTTVRTQRPGAVGLIGLGVILLGSLSFGTFAMAQVVHGTVSGLDNEVIMVEVNGDFAIQPGTRALVYRESHESGQRVLSAVGSLVVLSIQARLAVGRLTSVMNETPVGLGDYVSFDGTNTMSTLHAREQEEVISDSSDIFVMPLLINGLAGFQRQIRYPFKALDAGVEGRVVVRFIVDESGEVKDAAVVQGLGYGCDEEALRVVRAATFRPGTHNGQKVSVQMVLPIRFVLT